MLVRKNFIWYLYEGLASYKGLAFAKILYVSFYTFLTKNVQEFTLSYKIPIKLVKNVYDFYISFLYGFSGLEILKDLLVYRAYNSVHFPFVCVCVCICVWDCNIWGFVDWKKCFLSSMCDVVDIDVVDKEKLRWN